MRNVTALALVLGAVLGVSTGIQSVAAQDAPDAPRAPYWDDGSASVYIANQRISGSDPERYAWTASLLGRIGGRRASNDTLIITIKERGRTVGTKRCTLSLQRSGSDEVPDSFQCRMDDIQVDHGGTFTFSLAYEDQNGTVTQLRDLTVPIVAYSYMIDRQSRRHTAMYMLAADDLLGSSTLFLDRRGARWNTAIGQQDGQDVEVEYRQSYLAFRFWSTRPNLSLVNDTQVRCTVDGAALDIERTGAAQIRPQTNYYGDDRRSNGTDVAETRYAYNLWEVQTGLVVVEKGARSPLPPVGPGQRRGGQHLPTPRGDVTTRPGHWACVLRAEGHEIRRFEFNVSADGIVRNTEMEGADGLHMGADEFFVDTYILPAASDFDRAYVRDAVQAGGYFGRAWTTRPAMLADTARSFGTAHPPAVAGGGGRRH